MGSRVISRNRSVLVSVCLVAASIRFAHASGGSKAVDPAVVEFLLTSAAQDFHDHGPSPLRFRKVRVGHALNPAGEAQYRLCGQFQTTHEAKAEWVPFATLKTSGYEQWIGSTTYCEGSSIVWDKEGDLSSSLQKKLDALRHP